MKKFLTLLMAMVVTLSMFATPQLNKTMPFKQGKKESKEAVQQAKAEKFLNAFTKKAEKQVIKRNLLEKKSIVLDDMPSEKPQLKKVSRIAQGEELTFTFDAFAYGPHQYEDGDWFISLLTADYAFYFDYFNNGTGVDYCGTYTMEDFLTNYSYIMLLNTEEYILFEDITLTVSETVVNEKLSVISLVATILGDDGNTYKVTAKQNIYNPQTVVEESLIGATLNQTDKTFTFSGKNANVDATVSIYLLSSSVVGNYDAMQYFDLANTVISYKGTTLNPMQMTATVDLKMQEDGTAAYTALVNVINVDTVLYTLKFVSPLPKPIDTVDVVCSNLVVDNSYAGSFGIVFIEASNAEYQLSAGIMTTILEPGVYEGANCMVDITASVTSEYVSSIIATLTVSIDDNDNYVIKGQVLGNDDRLYNLDLSWIVPEPTKTVDIKFEKSAIATYYPDLGNDFMLMNGNAEYLVALDIVGVPMGATFTQKDLYEYYCFIENLADETEIEIAAADGKVYQSNDTTYMEASIIGFDAVRYNIELWYVAPIPAQTVSLNFSNAIFYNQLENDGYYALVAANEDETVQFALSLPGYSEEDVPGTYVNDGLFGGFTGANYDFINYIFEEYATYIAKWNAELNDYDVFTIEKGQATITVDEENNLTMTGWFIALDGVKYDITLTSKVDKPRLDYDSECCPVERIFTNPNEIYIEDYSLEEGVITFELITADEMEIMALWFVTETSDPDIIIPEGIYTIDASWDYETVVASEGYLGNNLYPSFYGKSDGEMATFYFLVSGTVEVSKNSTGKLRIEVNAFNSYDIPVHIVYDASANTTAIEYIQTEGVVDVQKKVVDGQLFIIRNGKVYTSTGVQVK